MTRSLLVVLALVIGTAFSACRPPKPAEAPARPDTAPPADRRIPFNYTGRRGLVVAAHPLAAEAGLDMLKKGGNAVDAVVAAAFSLNVAEPFASGIGGGGAALVVPTDGAPVAYDYREVVADDGVVPSSGTGVPGFVAGMALLHAEHGTLPWAELLAPAIALARDGHPVSEMLAVQLRDQRGLDSAARLAQFAPGGRPLAEGELLVQEELAQTMELLAQEGPAAAYTGALADALTTVQGIDAGSLAGYTVQVGEPVSGTVGDYRVLSAPPALPGVALIQLLQVAEALGIAGFEPGSAEFVRAIAAAWQVAGGTVATELGDPAFVEVPVERLTDPARNAEIAAGLPAVATAAQGGAAGADENNTTHVSVVDADGLTVSMTNTLTLVWGSGTYVGGFFLNNQLTRFTDLGTGGNNVPAPGRRSATWSTPTVLVDGESRPVLALGSPGGDRIVTVLAQVIARWALHGQSLADAVAAGRVHPEGSLLRVESMPSEDVAAELRARGFSFRVVDPMLYYFGSVQALAIDHDTGQVTGAADTRREAGFVVVEP